MRRMVKLRSACAALAAAALLLSGCGNTAPTGDTQADEPKTEEAAESAAGEEEENSDHEAVEAPEAETEEEVQAIRKPAIQAA